MTRTIGAATAAAAVGVVLGGALLAADTLVLRDGRRINGQLVSVQRGVIEFREDRGFRGSRTIEVPRRDVQRIDLDEERVEEPSETAGRFDRQARPSGLREREVWVQANQPWIDTGLDVRVGQVVYFSTHGGDIQYRRGAHTRANGDENSQYGPNRPMPGRAVGALIGKVGIGSRDYFFIGENEGGIRIREPGRLFLGINDDYFADNSGAYRVTVSY